MKPAPFAYHSPDSVDEVVACLSTLGDEAKLLAGGQSLIPVLAMRLSRFEHLVDLRRVAELRGVETADAGVRIGAMTTQSEIEVNTLLEQQVPLLFRATPLIGHFQIRNRGTFGGSIAHADPAAEYPAVVLALDAQLEIVGPQGKRLVPASDFFLSTFETALGPDELLAAVYLPARRPRMGFAVEELARRHGDFALAGAACTIELDAKGRIAQARVSLFGLDPRPRRATSTEQTLVGCVPSALNFEEVGQAATADTSPHDDVHASATYRRHIGALLVARVLRDACEEAQSGE